MDAMKRIVSMALVFALLILVAPLQLLTVNAASTTATISFADVANRTEFNTSKQVWQQNGITVTNEQGASTSKVADYFNPVRFYKSSTLAIAYEGMTGIAFNCNTAEYAASLEASISAATGTEVARGGSVVTVTFASAVASLEIASLAAQVRMDSITVYSGGDTPEAPEAENPAAAEKLTIAEAIAMGTAMESNTYTTEKYRVTGVITEVYNTQYGNMYIADDEGNTLTIYGSYDATGETSYAKMDVQPVAGDTVTIYGAVGQYNGTAQIKNGWIVEHTPAGETPEEPETPDVPTEDGAELTIAEAIAIGAAMEHNTYTEVKYTVTGVITEVYNTQYGNMKITDEDGNILTIYGTYDATGEIRYDAMDVQPAAGDTVTIYGMLGQFNGTPQIKNGWIVEHIPAGTEPEQPEDPETPDADGTVLTVAEAIAMGSAMEHNTYTEVKYTVTGVITEVYNTQYGNMKITDEDGNILTIYGTYDATGEVRYDAMEVKPVAGDTVTIYGMLGQFNGTPQIKNGWIMEHAAGEGTPEEPEVPELPTEDGAEISIADAIAAGKAMEHNTYTEVKYTVTGVITEVYNTQYGNMKIADEDGNILTIYGTYDATGEVRYDAMEVKPVAGDTVTIYGVVGQFNGTPQIKNGWIVEHIPAGTEAVDADFNGDGQVTDADAIYLLRHTLFPENYEISGDADFNGDGSVTDADAIYLLRHTLFPENYPLLKKEQ